MVCVYTNTWVIIREDAMKLRGSGDTERVGRNDWIQNKLKIFSKMITKELKRRIWLHPDLWTHVWKCVPTYFIIAIYHMVIWPMQAFTEAWVSLVRVSDCQTGS